jgi:hypothetical protein
MILTAIDFDVEPKRRVPVAAPARLSAPHQPDRRLDLATDPEEDQDRRVPPAQRHRVRGIGSILRASQPRAAERAKELLKAGVSIAAKNDVLFGKNLALWKRLIAMSGEEFDHDLGISRSHRMRRWRGESVLRITPGKSL